MSAQEVQEVRTALKDMGFADAVTLVDAAGKPGSKEG